MGLYSSQKFNFAYSNSRKMNAREKSGSNFKLTRLFGRTHVKEMFLADLRKTREQLKGQPEEMAKVNKIVFA